MEQLPPLGTAIADVVLKTFQIYQPLLLANATSIKSTQVKTFTYGPHPRQALDVYYPSIDDSSSPILIFFYGGGLVRGDKTLPGGFADGLVHANIGHFFADKFGYTVVVADYRLISHGAKFPSGGEDMALVVEWVRENLVSERRRDLFLMGNSAGGIHLSTFLFAPAFEKEQKELLSESGDWKLGLRGAVLLSVPFHFRGAAASRAEILETYFGKQVEEHCPLGLLRAAIQRGENTACGGVKLLVLNGTLDPDDEILIPRKDFLEEWNKANSAPAKKAMAVEMMDGQNHISPPLSLGTGIPAEEAWGCLVGAWMDSNRS